MSQKIAMVVVCHNAGGEPDVFRCEVEADSASGDQYDLAIAAAEGQGYGHPMVAADETDVLFKKVMP